MKRENRCKWRKGEGREIQLGERNEKWIPSIHLSIYLLTYLSISSSIYLSIYKSIYLCIWQAIYLPIYLDINGVMVRRSLMHGITHTLSSGQHYGVHQGGVLVCWWSSRSLDWILILMMLIPAFYFSLPCYLFIYSISFFFCVWYIFNGMDFSCFLSLIKC